MAEPKTNPKEVCEMEGKVDYSPSDLASAGIESVVKYDESGKRTATVGGRRLAAWLGQVHPVYTSWKKLWEFYWQSYLGGPYQDRDKYIFAHPRESAQLDSTGVGVKRRRERAWFINYCKYVVDSLVMTIWSQGVARPKAERFSNDKAIVPMWDMFLADVDRAGNGIDNFMRKAATWAQVYGLYHIFVDRPTTEQVRSRLGRDVQTRQDEIDAGAWPYFVGFSPLEVTNWGLSDEGAVEWVVVKKEYRRQGLFENARKVTQYRLITKDEVRTYEDVDGRGARAVGEVRHNLGVLPIVTVVWGYAPMSAMESNSALEEVAAVNQAADNYRSLRDEVLYNQTFSQLVMAIESAEDIREIHVSTQLVIGYPVGFPPPVYIHPDPSQVESLSRAIEDARLEIFRIMNDRFFATREPPSQAPSGISQAYELYRRAFGITDYAVRLEEAENKLFRLWTALVNGVSYSQVRSEDLIATAAYPRKFDMFSTTDLIALFEQAERTFGAYIPVTAKEELVKILVGRLFPHLTDEAKARALEEIVNAAVVEREGREIEARTLIERSAGEGEEGQGEGEQQTVEE